jgi:hypothetical protein
MKAKVRASCLGNRNASCRKQKLLYFTDGATHFTTFLCTNVPGQDDFIILNNIQQKIWSNSGGVITDLGDGIINLEFLSK